MPLPIRKFQSTLLHILFSLSRMVSQAALQIHANSISPDPNASCEREGVRKIPSFWKKRCPAGLTIEASLGLTLFLLLLLSLCQIFLILQLQLRMQQALEEVGNEAAQYGYVSSQVRLWDSSSRLLTQIENDLLADLSEEALRLRFIGVAGEEYLDRSVIAGGADGISFAESSILEEENRLRLTVTYRIRLPVALLGLPDFVLRQQCYRYVWLGDAEPEKKTPDEEMVYVTKNSEVYHRSLSCTHLKLSVHSAPMSQVASLRNDNGARYYPCEHCRPDGTEATVYITNDGTRYHGDRTCGAITRNVTAIPIREAEGLRPCSRCGQAGE